MIQHTLFIMLKCTIAISVLVLFYKLVLSRLTFFNALRWYFLIGIVLSIFISSITISIQPSVDQSSTLSQKIAYRIPAITTMSASVTIPVRERVLDYNVVFIQAWWIGIFIFLGRFFIQFISLFRLRKKALKMHHPSVNIYLIQEQVSPFSFGDSIYLHPKELEAPDYEKIIAHEWIHIQQRHSLDMMFAELICILNWFNPFAWILKKSIRQNLEYLTDDIMLRKGTDAREYQYLLLRALGQGAFKFTPSFNYHSLKSRIIMINRFKSHPLQRFKFLLLAPVLLLILLAFRSAVPEVAIPAPLQSTNPGNYYESSGISLVSEKKLSPSEDLNKSDTIPGSKNKSISKTERKHEMSLSWSSDEDAKVKRITVQGDSDAGDIATVYLKNGNKEVYDLNDRKAKDEFEDKYGYINMGTPPVPPMAPIPPMPPMAPMAPMAPMPPMPPMAPMAPMAPIAPVPPAFGFGFDLPDDVTEISQTTESIKLKFKNGTSESYDLTDPKQKKKFRDKYSNHSHHED